MTDKLSMAAGWLGTGLAITGLILFGIRPDWGLIVTLIVLASLILLVFFFIIHFEAVKTFSTRRSTKLGLNSMIMTVIFISILGIINFIVARHSQRLDLSEIGRFTLASQTIKVLNQLDRKVKITAFTQSQTTGEVRVKDLLNSYTYHTNQISYELVDPDKKPAIAKNYGITQYNTLVFESGTQETQIKDVTEQDLTNAIIRVSKDEKRRVLFLKEHGEHLLDDTEKSGYSNVKETLVKQGYEVDTLSLLEKGEVPDNISVLVIAGPQKPFLLEEKKAVTTYLEGGGKLFILLDPQTQTNLEDFLDQWGIQLGHGIIIDTLSRLFGGDLTIPIVNTYPAHEITEGFNLATFFPVAQSISFEPVYPELDFKPIAQTTPNSWSKTNLNVRELRFNPNEDIQGPFTIAGIVTLKSEEIIKESSNGEEPLDISTNGATVAVFGDSDFASNASFYFSGNGDLFLNTINFLAKEKHLIAITPKEHRFAPLLLSKTQGQLLMYISVILIPAIVFITGFIVWRRRRRL